MENFGSVMKDLTRVSVPEVSKSLFDTLYLMPLMMEMNYIRWVSLIFVFFNLSIVDSMRSSNF